MIASVGLLGLTLGCSPAQTGEMASTPASAPSGAATATTPDAEDGGCMLAHAQGNARYIATVFRTVDAWARACHPHMDELEQLTWADIPESSQPLVEAHWHEQFRQAKAERALELGVPVSLMGCAPQHPDCETMTDDDAGLAYSALVRVAVLHVLETVQAAAQESTALRSQPIDERRARALVGAQERQLDQIRSAVFELHALLPTSGALPELQLPAGTAPLACR